MSTSNPFETTERWETSLDTMLSVGNHLVTIVEAEGGTAGTGNPQITLKFENAQGSIRAWESYHAAFLRKVATLYDCAGVSGPQPGEFDQEDNCRISQQCLNRLIGARIGIVIREEDDGRPDHYGEKRTRVKGYVAAAKITGGPDTRGLPQAGAQASTPVGAGQDRIPF